MSDESPTDYLFHVRIKNAIKIIRTVEVLEMKDFRYNIQSKT